MRRLSCSLLLLLAHCGEPLDGEDSQLPALEARAPAPPDQGSIRLGGSLESELSRRQRVHRWQFSLPHEADVTLWTGPSAEGDARVDTVLTLHRLEPRRWLAQDDDFERTPYSRIARALSAGTYELTVHGYSPRVRGRFALHTACTGPGCPAPEPRCLFGETFSDLRMHSSLSIEGESWITAAEQLASDAEREQVLLAVHQSTHTDVSSAAEAIERVDQMQVRRLDLSDGYLAFEYGAGDNSYGAVFAEGSSEVLASIQDGDLLHCTVLE